MFGEYWEQAKVLTADILTKYSQTYNSYKEKIEAINDFDDEIQKKLGISNYSNINRSMPKSTKSEIFLDGFLKSYQESVNAFRNIEEIYSKKKRKVDSSLIPIRLEIDSFFSFVRDTHALGESWKHQPILWDDTVKAKISSLIDEWLITYWPHFEETIVKINYPLINDVLGSEESIRAASMDEIFEALCVAHSFHDRLRFYKGGLSTLKKVFLDSNDIDSVKKTLIYLLHDKANDLSKRVADCIYNPNYKLNEFGQSNVQELIGWINHENLPVINGRTTKVLRYFGFNVRQIS